jgi:translation elongation factor EF-1beta
MRRLDELIHEIQIPGLRWSDKFRAAEDVAFGVKKLRVACTIDDPKLAVQTVIDAIAALHDGSAGAHGHATHEGHEGHGHATHEGHGHHVGGTEAKKMVQSVEFIGFTK